MNEMMWEPMQLPRKPPRNMRGTREGDCRRHPGAPPHWPWCVPQRPAVVTGGPPEASCLRRGLGSPTAAFDQKRQEGHETTGGFFYLFQGLEGPHWGQGLALVHRPMHLNAGQGSASEKG